MGIPLPRFPSLKLVFGAFPPKKGLERNCMILKITNNTTHYGKKHDIKTLKSTYIYMYILIYKTRRRLVKIENTYNKYKNKKNEINKELYNILHIIHYIDVYNFHNHLHHTNK